MIDELTYENLVRENGSLQQLARSLRLAGLPYDSVMEEIYEIDQVCIEYCIQKRKINELTLELGNIIIGFSVYI